MPMLIQEKHLLTFYDSMGISRESLADYDHAELLGLAMALLENEDMVGFDSAAARTYAYSGYSHGIANIAHSISKNSQHSDGMNAGTVSLRMAEHTIARVLEQIRVLDVDHTEGIKEKEVPFIPAILHSLYAAGAMIALMNVPGEPEQFKRAIKEVQSHMTASRRGLDDIKKSLRAKNLNV